MQQPERDIDLISVITADAAVLAARIDRFAMTEEKFVNDRTDDGELAFDAIMSPVYRIAEDAIHLSDEVTAEIPDVPWREIRGFRNFVAHGYREIDRRIAWKVASQDIPELASALEEYARSAYPLLWESQDE